jgi:predicted nucleotidyltransferase component of viral defense system
MIPDFCITEWRQQVPWVEDYQVEQDLIISRALVSLFERHKIKNSLVFRGGTALHKLYVKPAARYSEDIDLVQIVTEPIGQTLDEIRSALNWLGEPTIKLTERSAKLIYRYTALDNSKRKLKIEINTTEHYYFSDLVDYNFSVENSWYTGTFKLRTYQLNELMGSKMRALYQRRKGRDLFDLWIVLKNGLIIPQKVIEIYLSHCEKDNLIVTRALFEKSISEKIRNKDFKTDMSNLLAAGQEWSFDDAYAIVQEKLICLLPGAALKVKHKS